MAADHPAIGMPCGRCGEPFVAGDRTTLVPKTGKERDGWTVEAALIHADCATEQDADDASEVDPDRR